MFREYNDAHVATGAVAFFTKEKEMSNTKKAVAVVMCGAVMGFGGCLGVPSISDIVTYGTLEYLFDNDGGDGFSMDLFQDDFGTGTQYDDRFVADASRTEPDAEVTE